MWLKKKWILFTVLAGVVILIAGTIGGVVYAQSTDTQGDISPGKTLMARVANILGIDQTKLEDAFIQAQKEMQNEELTNRLNKMVQDGTLTQSQADQYKEWVQSKPDMPAGLGLGNEMGFPRGPGWMHGPGGGQPPAPPASTSGTN